MKCRIHGLEMVRNVLGDGRGRKHRDEREGIRVCNSGAGGLALGDDNKAALKSG